MIGSNQIVKIISFASCKYKLKREKKFCREKPHDTEWLELRDQKVPLLLNYSQCKLNLQEFYPVIENSSYKISSCFCRMLLVKIINH